LGHLFRPHRFSGELPSVNEILDAAHRLGSLPLKVASEVASTPPEYAPTTVRVSFVAFPDFVELRFVPSEREILMTQDGLAPDFCDVLTLALVRLGASVPYCGALHLPLTEETVRKNLAQTRRSAVALTVYVGALYLGIPLLLIFAVVWAAWQLVRMFLGVG
jgi:hypothetical protein